MSRNSAKRTAAVFFFIILIGGVTVCLIRIRPRHIC
jgi:hypothetical protein